MTSSTAQVRRAFERSVFVMTSAAAIVLAVAEGTWFPAAITPGVAALAWFFVDHTCRVRLGVRGANILGVIAFLIMAYEFTGGTLLDKVFAGAHLLTWMTWIVLFIPKGIRQYWWLVVLAVLQISLAAVLTDSPVFGVSLAIMLLIMIWTLSIFTLYRIQLRTGSQAGDVEDTLNLTQAENSGMQVRNGIQIDSDEPWIGWRIRGITAFSFVCSLVIGTIAFLVFPRLWVDQQFTVMAELQRALPKQTGFTDEVQLGDLGQIMQSDIRVLQIKIRSRRGKEVTPDEFCAAMKMDELLLRGTTLSQYREGRWSNGARVRQGPGDNEHTIHPYQGHFRVELIHDPPVGQYLFAPSPATGFRVKSHEGVIARRHLSYAYIYKLKHDKARSEQITTIVECSPQRQSQLEFHTPRMAGAHSLEVNDAQLVCITRNLREDLPQLYELAQNLSENGTLETPELARRIYAHLMSEDFSYTLNAGLDNPSADPLEDFLFSRKKGHCEYFASAATLLFQASGVPARMVTGYKGCELNTVSEEWEVRQNNAHSWVEFLHQNRWYTLDPTPASRADEEEAETAIDWWMDLAATMRDGWFSVVQSMTLQRQEELVRPFIQSAQRWYQRAQRRGVLVTIREFFSEVVMHPEKWVSWKTGVFTFVLLLIPALVMRQRPDRALLSVLRGMFGFLRRNKLPEESVIALYRQYVEKCRRHGLAFAEGHTALESAGVVATHFFEPLHSAESGQLPYQIAQTFNLLRFGSRNLTEDSVRRMQQDVTRFVQIVDGRLRGDDSAKATSSASTAQNLPN